MENPLIKTAQKQLSKPLRFKFLNDIRDIKRLSYKDFVLVDSSKKMVEIVRLVAMRAGVAPVCLNRGYHSIRVYGEPDNLEVFSYIFRTIIGYMDNNTISRVRDRMEPNKQFPISRVMTHYRRTRDGLLGYLTSNPSEKNPLRTPYLYSLYLFVAKMEKLNPKKWGYKQEENRGYHYVTKTFYNKRILG